MGVIEHAAFLHLGFCLLEGEPGERRRAADQESGWVMETIVIIAVVVVAVGFIVWRFAAAGKGEGGCSCGCAEKKCGIKDCSSQQQG